MAFGIDDAALIGGLATVAAAGTSAIASGKMNKRAEKFNKEEAERQRQWNEAMAEKQNAWNYEMWLEQNKYNSPASQVERLRAAGLNPIYYGLDGSSAGEITAAQPLGYERAEISNYANPIAAGLDAASTIAQTKLAFSNAGRADKEGDLAAEKAITESLMRDRQYDFLGVQIDLAHSQENLNNAQIKKVAADIHVVEKQAEKLDVDMLEAYSRMDVAQRGQKLAEDTFEFSKAIQNSNLTLREKEVAVMWYNAFTQRLIGDADIQLKEGQKVYVGLQGEQVKAVTATENAMREGKVERQEIENKTAEREYKWMPVDKTVKAVSTAVGVAGAVMVGGNVAGKAAGAAAAKVANKATIVYDAQGNPASTMSW